MSWNREQHKNTLIIEKHGTDKDPVYKLQQFYRIRTPDGITYMSPLPNETGAIRALDIHEVQIIPPIVRKHKTGQAGDVHLTHNHSDTKWGGRA